MVSKLMRQTTQKVNTHWHVVMGEKKSQTLQKVQDSKICDKPRPIRFKSYPRVSQILLSCTSPGDRPYISFCLFAQLSNIYVFIDRGY